MGDEVLGSSRRGDGESVARGTGLPKTRSATGRQGFAVDQGRVFLDLAMPIGTCTQLENRTKVDTVTVKCRTPAPHDLDFALKVEGSSLPISSAGVQLKGACFLVIRSVTYFRRYVSKKQLSRYLCVRALLQTSDIISRNPDERVEATVQHNREFICPRYRANTVS